ncbi:MAG: hypothetical protein Q4C47_03085, partial [Planctomycetia bacterium]|nr:hypothetical protein [Planctomycetia bacterium]
MKNGILQIGLVAMLLLLPGCGDGGKARVHGTANFSDGEPIPFGIVTFSDGKNMYTGEVNQGVFEMGTEDLGAGVPPG